MGTIVVGVDGSAPARKALRFALEEARLRGGRVVAVHAWSFPTVAAGPGIMAPIDAELLETMRQDAEEELERVVAEVAEGGPDVEVERATVEGPAAQVLIDACDDAELLVVGSRGRGGFAGLLLGSVSQQCAHHAPCPLVIVRKPREP